MATPLIIPLTDEQVTAVSDLLEFSRYRPDTYITSRSWGAKRGLLRRSLTEHVGPLDASFGVVQRMLEVLQVARYDGMDPGNSSSFSNNRHRIINELIDAMETAEATSTS